MANIIDELKDKMEGALAELKSEMGIFLQQDARIRTLTPGLLRESLLAHQKELEQRGASLAAKGSAMAQEIGQFNPWDLSAYKKLGSKSGEALKMVADLASLRTEMMDHVSKVDKAVGESTSRPTATSAPKRGWPTWALYAGLAAIPLGFLAIGALEARRNRRG